MAAGRQRFILLLLLVIIFDALLTLMVLQKFPDNLFHFKRSFVALTSFPPLSQPKVYEEANCEVGGDYYRANNSTLAAFAAALKSMIPSPDKFDPHYKSPCWKGAIEKSHRFKKSTISETRESMILNSVLDPNLPPESLFCVPQVYFTGFPRSGSTQLYRMLTQHPLIVGGKYKEPHWWTRSHYTPDVPRNQLHVLRYLLFFKSASLFASEHKDALLLDASQSTIWDIRTTSNTCFLPELLSEVVPRAKFIVLMRNPLDRLYSDFSYLCDRHQRENNRRPIDNREMSANFHRDVVFQLNAFKECMKKKSVELCVHDSVARKTPSTCGYARLGVSVYHVHIQRWLRTIPREQFLFLRTDDLALDPLAVLREVWKLLGVKELEESEMGEVLHSRKHKSSTSASEMDSETRELLRMFFQPHNDALAELLGADKFRWT